MKKGFVFGVDAMVAVSVAIVLLSIIFYHIGNLESYDLTENDLLEYVKSVTSIMELQNSFGKQNVQGFFGNYTRNETCFLVAVYDDTNIQEYNVTKYGCQNFEIAGTRVQLTRMFYTDKQFKIAKVYGWYE